MTLSQISDFHRQHRDARRNRGILLIRNIELTDILPSDAVVRADIDDVNAWHLVPEMIQNLGDQPTGDHGLAETHLIRDQKAMSRLPVEVHALKDVFHGVTLESLEALQNGFRIGTEDLLSHRTNSCRAAQIGSHTELNP